jgi:predicted TPR repeat methyltransferase
MRGLLLFIALGSALVLLVPELLGTANLLLYKAWVVVIGLALLWQLGRVLADNRHYFSSVLGRRTAKAPRRYVRGLFDGYAARYDRSLMVDLAYAAPNLLRGIVGDRLDDRAPVAVLDLGCGTGICGPLFRPLASRLVGVDLSPGMLARARERGVYDDLVEADLVDYVAACRDPVELCIAADVFVYLGDLAPALAAIAQALAEGGYLAFTVESAEAEDWVLRRSGRYAHGRGYVRRAALASGLEVEAVERATLRTENDKPVPGDVWLLRRPPRGEPAAF